MIDGIYKNQSVFIKIGFMHSKKASHIAKKVPMSTLSLFDELSINKKIKKMKLNINIPTLIDGFVCKKGTMFKTEMEKMEKIKKEEEQYEDIDGLYNYNKLIILVFSKINFISDLLNFRGSFNEWKYLHRQIMKIIKNLHYHGIFHNDLNFSNILITNNDLNKKNKIYIIDFGNSVIKPNKHNNFMSHSNNSSVETSKSDLEYYLSGFTPRYNYNRKGMSQKMMTYIKKIRKYNSNKF